MTTTSSYEKKWLIKSDQKISGPFSYEQIEDQLRKKQISVIDEIRDMEKRWSFIREVPELKTLVENIRMELDSSSDLTQTVQTRAHQETLSITKNEMTVSQTGEESTKDRLNGDEPEDDAQSAEINEVNESTFERAVTDQEKVSSILDRSRNMSSGENAIDIDFKEKNFATKAAQLKPQLSRFGAVADYNVQKEVRTDKSKVFITFFIIVAIFAASYFGYVYNKQEQALKAEAESVNQIRRFAINKNDQKVIEAYTKAPLALQRRVLADLINYFPLLQNSGVSANDEFIQRFKLENNLNNVKKSLLDMFLFHRSMSMKDFESAKKYLLSAKDADPTSEIVLENEAIFLLQMEKYKEALEAFTQLAKREDKKGRWFLGLLMAKYKIGKFEIEEIQDQQEALGMFLNTRADFKRELLLFQIFLSKKEHNNTYLMRLVREYINAPTQFAVNFRADPLIWMRGYDYKILDSVFKEILEKNPEKQKQKVLDLEPLRGVFLAAYALETGNYSEVDNFLKSAIVPANDADKVNINFQYLMIQGRKMEALAVLKTSGVDNLHVFSHLLLFKALFESKNLRDMNPDFYNQSLDYLRRENQDFLSTYARFILISRPTSPEERNKLREFLEVELVLNGEFTPFLEAKGELN
jgi:hypothetical protein